jgi:hypothetical protein
MMANLAGDMAQAKSKRAQPGSDWGSLTRLPLPHSDFRFPPFRKNLPPPQPFKAEKVA